MRGFILIYAVVVTFSFELFYRIELTDLITETQSKLLQAKDKEPKTDEQQPEPTPTTDSETVTVSDGKDDTSFDSKPQGGRLVV